MSEQAQPGRRLMMGNEAIAFGAIRAGVKIATGYPGTPSSEILETLAREKPEGVYLEWSVNEKVAVEVAAGAAISGARALATMKQVGLNVASDPLMSLNYVGVKGGMVIVVADDPGPISSQTEQDTRHFAQFAKIAVFDPSTPEEAYLMVADAFDCSERLGRPVLFRPTTRVCHSYATVDVLEAQADRGVAAGFAKEGGRWVIFPKLAYANHVKIEGSLADLRHDFSKYAGNMLIGGGTKGIAAGGVSWQYAREALSGLAQPECKLLKIGALPMPERLCLDFLRGLDEALVIEELDPVIERELVYLCGRHGIRLSVKGKLTGHMPHAGENSPAGVRQAICDFLGFAKPLRTAPAAEMPTLSAASQAPAPPAFAMSAPSALPERTATPATSAPAAEMPTLAARPPMLCAGCPHRASFFAVKEAAKGRKAVFSGDIGCYTLGNAKPLDMVDTCLCMGAGITQAQGIHRADPKALNFAFIGDSTFFHTGMPGVANAVYNRADIVVAVLDNSTTAMTGGQPNPGMGKALMGGGAPRLSIYGIIAAMGVDSLQRVDAFDFGAAVAAARKAADATGVRVIIFEGLCIALAKKKPPLAVAGEACSGCGACMARLGCPAVSRVGKKAVIDAALCTGCGLCANLCHFGAISGRSAYGGNGENRE